MTHVTYASPTIDVSKTEKLKTDNWAVLVVLFIIFVITQTQLVNAINRCYSEGGTPSYTNMLLFTNFKCYE